MTPTPERRVPAHLAYAAILAVAAGILVWGLDSRPQPSDFGQLWAAARALVRGDDPWTIVGPGRSFEWRFPLLYPMTAFVAALPFAWLPLRAADAVFAALGTGACAWALSRTNARNPQLLVFVSASFFATLGTSQWSPVLIASALTPALGFLLACKPSIGAALLIAYPSRRAFIGCAVFVAITLLIDPWWWRKWTDAMPAAAHMTAPVMRFGGMLLPLALLRWRLPEARLLAGLSLVPQTPVLYDTLPLFLIVRTWREATTLVIGSFVVLFSTRWRGELGYNEWMAVNGQWIVWAMYLPCLAFVLLRSEAPNQKVEGRAVAGEGLEFSGQKGSDPGDFLARGPIWPVKHY